MEVEGIMPQRVRRRHHMPFGAELTASGQVRFRLWAPAAQQVEVALYNGRGTRLLPMDPLPGGWFALETDAARAGSLYRYRIDGGHEVADPASRSNPQGVHGPSAVTDPLGFAWEDDGWSAPPWHHAVIYELHVGTFTTAGTYAGVAARLEHLARLGVTAIELMPLGSFPGIRDWGYDGVLPFAPQASYGTPDELKALIAAAHRQGLAVLLDVVYNHFGPEGNYLHRYAPQFFSERHATPWGPAINFDGARSDAVRDFFIHNALYWLEEYHFDGLRLDAIHAVHDTSATHIVTEIARAVREGPGQTRTVYLTLENLDNAVRFLGAPGAPSRCDAQWNDDTHHALHVLLTGETSGYYTDYASEPEALLCRALAQGFAYQGEVSPHLGRPRGERSAELPPSAFVNFLQNHDQIGNRARGERLTSLVRDEAALRAAAAIVLIAPSPPLLFMGEEWGALEPFPWFCDFEPELAARVHAHRSREHPGSSYPAATATFASARLDWRVLEQPAHARTLAFYRQLLALRRERLVPLIPQLRAGRCTRRSRGGAFSVSWTGGGQSLRVIANLAARPAASPESAAGRVLFATHSDAPSSREQLPPWSVIWLLAPAT
jgi:malto-oligosyltrehalose trehalohydrolase